MRSCGSHSTTPMSQSGNAPPWSGVTPSDSTCPAKSCMHVLCKQKPCWAPSTTQARGTFLRAWRVGKQGSSAMWGFSGRRGEVAGATVTTRGAATGGVVRSIAPRLLCVKARSELWCTVGGAGLGDEGGDVSDTGEESGQRRPLRVTRRALPPPVSAARWAARAGSYSLYVIPGTSHSLVGLRGWVTVGLLLCLICFFADEE